MPNKPPKYSHLSAKKKKPEISVNFGAFDTENPRSLINIVSPRLQELILNVVDPELGNINWLSWPESKLERKLTKKLQELYDEPDLQLGQKDHSLRISFWSEYYRAQDTKSKMLDKNICRCITFTDDFYRKMGNTMYAAWIITAPTDLGVSQDEALMQSMRLLREVVTNRESIWEVTETESDDGEGKKKKKISRKLNVKAVSEVRRIAQDLANRRQGAIVSKHQHLIASMNGGMSQIPEGAQNQIKSAPGLLPKAKTREDIEREINILEAEMADEGGGDGAGDS